MLSFRRATCARGSGQRSACRGNRDGWSARPSQQGDRAASAACDTPKAGSKNASGQVRNDGRGQVESGREPSRPKPLDIKGPIQGLLRLQARYGPLDCSTAQGGLCHEASTRSVTRPSRSSATEAIDNSPGEIFLHWWFAPSGRTEYGGLIADDRRGV